MVTMSILTRHTVSGVIGPVHEDIFNHPDLGKYLERVDEDAKPYLPEMHKPREAEVVDPDAEVAKREDASAKTINSKDKD